MTISRALAACVLAQAVVDASALLAAGHPEDHPDAAGSQRPRLARYRQAHEEQDQDDLGNAGVTVDYPGCEPQTRPDLAKRLRKQYKRKFKSKVEAAFASLERPAYLTVGEARSKFLLRNFLAHMRNVTIVDNTPVTVVNVQLDKDGMVQCKSARDKFGTARLDIRCVNLGGWLPSDFFGRYVNSGPGTCVYNMIIWSKPDIFLTAAKASPHHVMMVDTDVMIYHDLFTLGNEILSNHSTAKLVVAHENHGRRNPNTGVVLVTKEGIELVQRWADANIEYVNDFAGDQSAFAGLAKYSGLFWKRMSIFRPTQVGQCGERGEWATHYNCLGGRKKQVMRNRGDWDDEAYGKFKFGQKEKAPPKKISQEANPLRRDAEAEVVEMMKAGGDWWVNN